MAHTKLRPTVRRFTGAGAVGLGLLVSACSATSTPTPGPGSETVLAPSLATVTAVRDVPTTVRPGQTLTVVLPTNPSTGHGWVLAAHDASVLEEGRPFAETVMPTRAAGVVGAPGQARRRFVAKSPGQVTLVFEYRQAWSLAAAAETARFPVTVR